MFLPLMLALASGHAQARVIEISEGRLLTRDSASQPSIKYWGAEDTYLDLSAPDTNNGGSMTLLGGPGHVILIRFGDLGRAVGSTRHVRKATLFLTPSGGETPTLRSVSRMLQPWGEGPMTPLAAIVRQVDPSSELGAKKPGAATSAWSATWRQRRAGTISWQQPGAAGSSDSEPITGAKLEPTGKGVAVANLTGAVQQMVDRWYDNDGFALQFDNAVEFYSSKAQHGRPTLELELDEAPEPRGADLSVVSIERETGGQAPKEGETVRYAAHVKNVGDAPSQGFSSTWVIAERMGSAQETPNGLRPGEELTLTYEKPYHPSAEDPRQSSIGLKIVPKGPDAVPGNDYLEVFEGGRTLRFSVSSDAAAKLAIGTNSLGSKAPEDWLQEQVRAWNDVYCAHSRYSFAPEGAKQRVSVGHIDLAKVDPNAITVSTDEADPLTATKALFHLIGQQLGLFDLSPMSLKPGSSSVPGSVGRGCEDAFGGVMGGGDTRYEGSVLGGIELPYEPVASQLFDGELFEPTGLLDATSVTILNGLLTLGATPASPAAMPKTIVFRAINLESMQPIGSTEFSFFQSKGGKIGGETPAFSITTSENGGAILPHRGTSGPFGALDIDGGNGVFLIRTTVNGTTEFGWLKAWQLIDMCARGNDSAAVITVRFNVPTLPLDSTTNLAGDRIVTDSANSLPAKLAPLNDGAFDSEAQLGANAGDWVEMDLGRDRTLGEIRLFSKSRQFWQRFDIVGYATGQTASDAITLAREVDWKWTVQNRADLDPKNPDIVSVAYRGAFPRLRFIRLVNRSGGPGGLSEISVTPARVAPGS